MIKNLKSLRQDTKTSQQQLADFIQVSQQSVNKYENHDVEPDINTLIKIAEYFNVSLDYLTGRSNIPEMADKMHLSDLSDKEILLIKKFRELDNKIQDLILQLVENYNRKVIGQGEDSIDS